MKKFLFLTCCTVFIFSQTIFALQVVDGAYGIRGTKVIKDDYSQAKSEWITYDSDGDGLEEYHYFDSNGLIVTDDTTPDGYKVNINGEWVVDGVVQKKPNDTNEQDNSDPYFLRKSLKQSNSDNTDDQSNLSSTTNTLIQPSTTEAETEANKQTLAVQSDDTENDKNAPTRIPPKAIKAIKKIKFWCNEDSKPSKYIVPYSKRLIKYLLKISGYKKDIINRAVAECGINWNEHALIKARDIKDRHKNYDNRDIKDLLKDFYEFTTPEIDYALAHLNDTERTTEKYIRPSDFTGLTEEQSKEKLKSYGLDDEQVKQALLFIKDVED